MRRVAVLRPAVAKVAAAREEEEPKVQRTAEDLRAQRVPPAFATGESAAERVTGACASSGGCREQRATAHGRKELRRDEADDRRREVDERLDRVEGEARPRVGVLAAMVDLVEALVERRPVHRA
eukprot:2361604-Prymnesium_polylepis.1